MEGKDGLKQRTTCPWSVCIRGPGHQTTGYNFICCEQLPEWYEQWTQVEIIMNVTNRKMRLTLIMNNKYLNRKTIWEDLRLDITLPEHIALGFSASTGDAISKHQVSDVVIEETFFSENVATPVGKNTKFHSVKDK